MLAQQDQTQGHIEVTDDLIINSIVHSGISASATSPKLPRVPITVSETDDYEKYYVPKVVSIGPYHFGNSKLQLVEKLKPVFAMKLLSNEETLRSLYNKLGEPQMVQDLRSHYEKDSTTRFCNKEFTKMMLLDGCFILYYIKFIYFAYGTSEDECQELKGRQIVFVHQDLFLLENQIPYKVLWEVAQMTEINLHHHIKFFIHHLYIMAPSLRIENRLIHYNHFVYSIITINDEKAPDHLLQIFHSSITKKDENPVTKLLADTSYFLLPGQNFRNASELVDVGIQFKPSDNAYLSSVKFSKGWLRFTANVELPRIIVNGSTKHMLLNMIAYETRVCSVNDAWVTSYVCLLDSLIDQAEDVKILRKSWVLDTSLGSDEEVAKLFNEIATGLAPNNLAYVETRLMIQRHYVSWSNTLFSQLKNEYFRSPWAIFVLLGALLGLILTAIQTYSGLTGECDDLCKLLKKNHHL